jgi:hypothetical protein
MSRNSWRGLRWISLVAILMMAGVARAQDVPPPPDAPPTAAPPAPAAATPAPDPAAVPSAPVSAPASPGQPVVKTDVNPGAAAQIELPTGTRIPLVLHNGVSTRTAQVGDPVYFETLFPVMKDGRVIVPAGSYVSGEVTESKRPGRVKGRGELNIRLMTLILPNAYMVKFAGVPSGASTGGNETTNSEGKIIGDSDKTSDVGTIAKTTGAGAAIGGIASRSAGGAGIGAGVGAAVGLAAILLTRGPEAELPRGTTLDAVLDRPLYFDADKVQFTSPGQSSTLAGPANREPQRSKVPY